MSTLLIGNWKVPDSKQALKNPGYGVLDGVTITFGRQNQLDNPEIGTLQATIRCETIAAAKQAHKIRPGQSCDLKAAWQLSHTTPKTVAIKDGWITPYLTDSGQATGWSEWAGNYYIAGNCWIGTGPWNTGNPQEWRYLADRVEPGSIIAVDLTITAPPHAPAPPKARLTGTYNPESTYLTVLESDPELKPEHLEGNTWQIQGEAPIPIEGYPVLYLYAPAVTWNDYPETDTWETIPNPSWRIWGCWKVEKTLKLSATARASQAVWVFSGVITSQQIKGLPGGKSEITITASDHLHPLNAAKIAAARREAEPLTDRIKWVLDQTADYLTNAGYTPLAVIPQSDINPMMQSIDVDARGALELINQAATSAALTAWPVVSQGGDWGIFLEDADTRPAISYITLDAAGIVGTEKAYTNCLIVDGSQIPLEGVQITKDGEVAATQCEVTYPIEKTDPQTGQISYETGKTLTGYMGPVALKIDTWLKNPADATDTGNRWLRRVTRGDWKISGIRINTARLKGDTSAGQLIDILYRIGQQLVIYSMPAWIPGARSIERFCIEGGTLTAHKTGWIIDLNLTRPGGAGYALKWEEIPAPAIWEKTPIPWARFAALTTKAKIKEGYKDARNN